jgi:phosphate uptake regulator
MLRNLFQAVQNGEILLEIGLKKPSDCLAYRTVIRCIERIADHSVLIAKRIKFLTSPIDKKTLQSINQLSESALNVFENSIQALTKSDYSLAEKVAAQAAKTVQDEKEVMSNLKESESSSVIKFVLEDIRRMVEYSTDIAEVVINENIRSVISEK